MSSLSRQCCCENVPSGPCDICDFCDCECTKSITITVSGTYSAALSSENSAGNSSCGTGICSPFCNEVAGSNNCGNCLGVVSISGSWTVPFVSSANPGDNVTQTGTCETQNSTGCRNWAGFVSPASMSFAKNPNQQLCQFVYQSCAPNVYSSYHNPCDALKVCTWKCETLTGLECGANWSNPTPMNLVQPIESYVRLQCLTGISSRINIFPYMKNCKHSFSGCGGDAVIPYFAPPIYLGWSQKRDCPSDSSLTYSPQPGWITCNVSVT